MADDAGFRGADPHAMAALARQLESRAATLEGVLAGATAAATGLSRLWRGPDAVELHQRWLTVHRQAGLRAVAGLHEAAATVERNGRAQLATSAADDAAAGPGRGPGPGDRGGGSPTGTGPGSGDAGTGKITDGARITGWSPVEGPLFRAADGSEGAVDANDIDQMSLGDCYFLSALAGLAHDDPDAIRNAIVDNGDGTYTVTLHERRDGVLQPVAITVDATMPVTERYNAETGAWVASDGFTAGPGDRELWPRIFEKAYASMLGDGDLVAGYAEIIGGDGREALQVLTGVESSTIGTGELTIERLAALHDGGVVLPASHRYVPGSGWWVIGRDTGHYDVGDDQLVTRHQYWVEHVDVEAGTVTVRNPWEYDGYHYELTMDEFNDEFREIDVKPGGPVIEPVA